MLEFDAILRNYRFVPIGGDRLILTGDIFQDKNKRFPDGTTVNTSVVVDVNKEQYIATTRNTRYKLENPIK